MHCYHPRDWRASSVGIPGAYFESVTLRAVRGGVDMSSPGSVRSCRRSRPQAIARGSAASNLSHSTSPCTVDGPPTVLEPRPLPHSNLKRHAKGCAIPISESSQKKLRGIGARVTMRGAIGRSWPKLIGGRTRARTSRVRGNATRRPGAPDRRRRAR